MQRSLTALTSLILIATTHADTRDYVNGGMNGNWNNPLNWSPIGVPGDEDIANIDGFQVHLTEHTAEIDSLGLFGGAVLRTNGHRLHVEWEHDDGGTIVWDPGSRLIVTPDIGSGPAWWTRWAEIDNGGEIELAGTDAYVDWFMTIKADSLFEGAGLVEFGFDDDFFTLLHNYGTFRTIGDLTLRRTSVGNFDMDGDGDGQVEIGGNDTLRIEGPNDGAFNGDMTFASGARFESTFGWTFGPNSDVEFAPTSAFASISMPTITTNGTMYLDDATVQATDQNTFTILEDGEVVIAGGHLITDAQFTNRGVVEMDGLHSHAGNYTNSGVIDGAGHISADFFDNNTVIFADGLLIEADNFDLDGESNIGTIVADTGDFTAAPLSGERDFHGRLEVYEDHTMDLSFATLDMQQFSSILLQGGTLQAGGLMQDPLTGTINVNGDSTLVSRMISHLGGDVVLGGDLTVRGALSIGHSANFFSAGDLIVGNNGAVRTTGAFAQQIDAGIENGGSLEIGFGVPQALTVNDDYAQTEGGHLIARIGFLGHDRLEVAGAATLGGTLEVRLDEGFQPPINALYDVVLSDDLIGSFDNVELPFAGVVEHLADRVRIRVTACTGDVDGDGQVGVNDLLIVLTEFGGSGNPDADIDQDGTVDVNDLILLLSNWGSC